MMRDISTTSTNWKKFTPALPGTPCFYNFFIMNCGAPTLGGKHRHRRSKNGNYHKMYL